MDKPFDFIGGSYSALSPNLDAQRTINLYLETDESGRGKNRGGLLGTPGLANFLMLPTAPIRGFLTTDAARLFVVAGSKYYEVFQGGTYTLRGDVGDDSNHSRVGMFVNLGNQVMIVSAGLVWIDDGITVERAQYQNGAGTVAVSGTAVTWISGSKFDSTNVGQPFIISGVSYTVASVADATHLVLTSSAGTAGTTTYTGTCDATGTAVVWATGTPFDPAWTDKITINAVDYVISEVTDPTHLDLTSTAGTQTAVAWSHIVGAPYSATYPVTGSHGAFLDGYFIVSKPAGGSDNSRQFNISAINDGKSWNPIDFAVKEGEASGILALLADHEELWIFGGLSIEVWQDTGAAAFPFQRNSSGFIPTGTIAPNSPTRLGDSVAWLGGDTRGAAVAYIAKGFIPARVSTHAVEAAWQSYAGVDDAVSYCYTEQGHQFWVLTFPAADATWVYDFTEQLWHERGWWDAGSGVLRKHRGAFHGFLWKENVVGDHTTGQLYTMSTALYDDAGVPIHRSRTAPHIGNSTLYTFFHRFTLDLEKWAGGSGTSILLDYSDDGGKTFITPVLTASAFQSRVMWRRLGRSRDRVFRISYSGGGRVCWINAHLEASAGTT